MHPRFAESYVERLFEQKDLLGLHQLISTLERDRELPKQCWLFCRLLEWEGSCRLGIWQYYEGTQQEEFEKIGRALDDAGLKELAHKYRYGMTAWKNDDIASALDKWIDSNQEFISAQLMCLLVSCREVLKKAAAN